MYAYHELSWGWFDDFKVATKRVKERRGSDGRWMAGEGTLSSDKNRPETCRVG